MKTINWRIQAVLALVLCYPLSAVVAGGLFRWVDSNGEVHYSDSVPPSASQSGHSELDSSGITRKRVAAAKSKQQAAEEAWLEELEAKHRKIREQQEREDNQLLSSYSTVDDFDSFHAGRIKMIQGARTQLEILREKLVKELEDLKSQQAKAESDAARQRIKGFIDAKQENLGEYDLAIQQNRDEEQNLQAEFEKQRVRFLDLQEKKLANAESKPKPASKSNVTSGN